MAPKSNSFAWPISGRTNTSPPRPSCLLARLASVCVLVIVCVAILCWLDSSWRAPDSTSQQLGPDLSAAELRASLPLAPIRFVGKRSLRQNQHQELSPNTSKTTLAASGAETLALASRNESQQKSGGCPSDAGQATSTDQHETYHSSFGFTQDQVSDYVKPTFYTLRLKVDPTKRKFTGQLMITVRVSAAGNETSGDAPLPAGAAQTLAPLQSPPPPPPLMTPDGQQQQALGHRYITLHSGGNIHIRKAFYVFSSRNSVQIPATKIGRNSKSELLTLDFYPNYITAGEGLLLLVYTGLVNDTDSHGLFVHRSHRPVRARASVGAGNERSARAAANSTNSTKSTNTNELGLATHMEPNFARRLLPSWDEPQSKARFSLIVVLPFRGYQSVSNMGVKRKSISVNGCSGEPLQEIEFHTTPTMSTYLLALVIGRLEFIESVTPNNCRVRVYFYAANSTAPDESRAAASATDNQQQHVNHRRQAAQMALRLAVQTFDRLESLLNVKYPLAKFDMIALRDFNSGGMENWGASIFHENYLLCDTNSSQADIRVNGGSNRPKRLLVPLVVAHEIAHQWFGNLLTARTWTYLWLNEGFAQLLMYDVADTLFPAHKYWHIFFEDSRTSAMREDELVTTSRPLEFAAANQDDQLALFDQLTYNKGAMVVRLLQLLVGRRQLFAGLQHYLLKHAYDSVDSHDLFQALEESTGRADRQLESVMTNWLARDGFPMLTVRAYHHSAAHWRLELTQERFTLLPVQALRDSLAQQQQAADNQSSAPNDKQPVIEWSAWTWSVPVLISSEREPAPDLSEPLLAADAATATAAADAAADAPLQPPAHSPPDSSHHAQPEQRPPSARGHAQSPPQQQQQQQQQLDVSQPRGFILPQDGPKVYSILVSKAATGSWFKLNANATGYYRVCYERAGVADAASAPAAADDESSRRQQQQQQQQVDLLALMVPAIRDKSMGALDRVNLIDDLFALTLAGKWTSSEYLKLVLDAYSNETELIVLRSIFGSLARIKAIVSSADSPLADSFDRYVQKYLRRLARAAANQREHNYAGQHVRQPTSGDVSGAAVGDSNDLVDRSMLSALPMTQASGASQQRELDELLGSMRCLFNEPQFRRQASELFSRHFRHQPAPPPTSSVTTQSPSFSFDSLDRELKASIYAAALTNQVRESTVGDLSAALSNERAARVTADSLPVSSNSRRSAASASAPTSSVAPAPAGDESGARQTDVFMQLLGAYDASESSNERYAISSALGSVPWPSKQLMLLNLTLGQSYFRPQDTQPLLEAMARTRIGRQSIWATLIGQSKPLETRQLLGAYLKSLAHGLVERRAEAGAGATSQEDSIEWQLKRLYSLHPDHGKLIVQTLELVRINSLWLGRERDSLGRYLESLGSD